MIAARIAMRRKMEELERSAKLAAQEGMFETGVALRNKAAGIRMAIEILEEDAKLGAKLTEVECLVKGGRP